LTASARFAVITLGCPKNEADSGRLERELAEAGHQVAAPNEADLLIVNTCGFIDAAKEESIDALLAAFGCLVARYPDELPRELPEIDVFAGFDRGPLLAELARLAAVRAAAGRPAAPAPRAAYRRRLPRPLHAYVKISDGCERACSYCAIPLIKGAYKAETPHQVLAQARLALADGVREITLVGQDTSRWRWPGYGDLSRLLADLAALEPLWLRVLYLQPDGVDDSLLEALARHAVPYIDLPLQHASRPVLARMGRRGDGDAYLALLERVRSSLPGVAVRSTFITGFPGETEDDVDALLEFIEIAELAVAGVFVFDPQEGTPAATLSPGVPLPVADERAARLTDAIERAARRFWSRLVGTEADVLVEHGTRGAGGEATGRIALQAPDVDGVTYIATPRPLRRGQVVRAVIESAEGFELSASAS
jgi:ribosomal protein S12 methylthiotransferase